MLYLKELARNQQWKDSDMQGVLQALGKSLTVSQDASGYNVPWKMLDACANVGRLYISKMFKYRNGSRKHQKVEKQENGLHSS